MLFIKKSLREVYDKYSELAHTSVVSDLLIYFKPMLNFFILWKRSKKSFFDFFKGYRNGTLA